MKRRLHRAKVKSEVVLSALQGHKTVAEIASQYHVHQRQVQEWKARALESLSGAFDKSSRKKRISRVRELFWKGKWVN